ncbi:hypothetical protein FRC08_005358 [Ceratobasidium sp. 394]|nr:hypothetical protein FRC08_005358 [Ceratobasidium sp. 394]
MIEHLHIDTLKELYRATNKKEWKKQTIQGFICCDKILDFGLWLDWRLKELMASSPVSGTTNGDYGVQDLPGQTYNIASMSISGNEHQQVPNSVMPFVSPTPFHPALNHLLKPSLSQAIIPHPTQLKRKRKQQTDEEKEEWKAKQVLQLQEAYRLLSHQDIALQLVNHMTI